ncbi:hypothetical protein [Prosthecodimorpha staleyi]|uniref:Uncharacterized protein n=1 Tax=Prosthecodimorpha staleyi TaxID=2840188 RepID=A0A947GEA7_9HYPH|nr:hypothetical protein [Prosthecodimorpha staleyi]MBT9289145.1 hypothetical protein [Prosthecodimorpha staleyi]
MSRTAIRRPGRAVTDAAARPPRLVPLALAVALALPALGGCIRQTGDFGRVEPNPISDAVLPFAGGLVAEYGRGELVSGFQNTDRELVLRERAWVLVVPPHTKDWIGEILVEGQRTRLLPEIDHRYNVAAYWNLLRSDGLPIHVDRLEISRYGFKSSEARWARLISDMNQDAILIGPFWSEARRVAADDRARLAAMNRRSDLAVSELRDATARIDENARVLDWVWRSMRFRLVSYRYAIDRLAVETPTDRRAAVERAYAALEQAIHAAERESTLLAGRPGPSIATAVKPSRLATASPPDEPVPQK